MGRKAPLAVTHSTSNQTPSTKELDEGEEMLHEACRTFLERAKLRRQREMARLNQQMQLFDSGLEQLQPVQAAESIISTSTPTIDTSSSDSQRAVFDFEHASESRDQLPHLMVGANHQRRLQARLYKHFDDLQEAYLEHHAVADDKREAFRRFADDVRNMDQFARLESVCRLRYGDLYNNNSIVSSIELDPEENRFATAGVSKQIRVYDYNTVLSRGRQGAEIHLPILTMDCPSKISCLAWNPVQGHQLASSDNHGSVRVWDVNAGTPITVFQEHERRVWSVDVNRQNPVLLASGSDDRQVKIWSTRIPQHSVYTMTGPANVCCVRFNESDGNYVAFGSADHHIHYYDLRKPNKEVWTFRGHEKAVSYVQFLSGHELLSASTDGTLRVWRVDQQNAHRAFAGHCNERNFVGLARRDANFFVTGSEDNAVYVYYKGLTAPLLRGACDTEAAVPQPVVAAGQAGAEPASRGFVSAVSWRRTDDALLVANSEGTLLVYQLHHE
ncbi:uncharacterized protein MONBRDRAFT_26379 [Monosiga brevicollis MX1]|uniref:Anaphase-promoting complex subunit 4 WD40 domain-containing protein n=1 Tax=Monosiga brevicollis TaxID=81824 RepID=A9V272_MONBE|nr:uncharacterized protein MONBRDRAFT_26379 [Monosiga brevicollis MX1]EDQ88328.1 predicted protein [Monosiga brevicollis MX1]|eukprot:XP_001746921.1 hypothetical protein [Monosiga brevicollis MX1]